MSTVSAPFGLKPVLAPGGGNGSTAITTRRGMIASGYAANIGLYSPIIITTAGVINIAATTGRVDGIFLGWRPLGTPAAGAVTSVPNRNWVSGTTYTGEAEFSYILFRNALGVLFEIQANGSLAQTSIGDEANLVNPGTVNGLGFSSAVLSTTLAGAGNNAQFQVVNLAQVPGNAWGDAFTVVQVVPSNTGFVAANNAF
jgi:hypothetical protein